MSTQTQTDLAEQVTRALEHFVAYYAEHQNGCCGVTMCRCGFEAALADMEQAIKARADQVRRETIAAAERIAEAKSWQLRDDQAAMHANRVCYVEDILAGLRSLLEPPK